MRKDEPFEAHDQKEAERFLVCSMGFHFGSPLERELHAESITPSYGCVFFRIWTSKCWCFSFWFPLKPTRGVPTPTMNTPIFVGIHGPSSGPLGKGPDFSPTSSASPGGILIMTSTHPLHFQSLHNHHDANPGPWGRARIFPYLGGFRRVRFGALCQPFLLRWELFGSRFGAEGEDPQNGFGFQLLASL